MQCDSLRASGIDEAFSVSLLGGKEFKVADRAAGSGLDKFKAAFFAASTDTAETNKKYAQSLRLDYPILSDPDKKVARAYGAVNVTRPVPFRWTFYIGQDRKILFIDKEVKPGSHGADVAAKLEELGVARK